MHISKLNLVNYRNFLRTSLIFQKGTNTIIGENGAGKTNAFRAIRLLLDDNLLRSAYKLDESDFCRALGDWKGHWIIICLEFDEISKDETIQALFNHGTAHVGVQAETATYALIFRPRIEVRVLLSRLSPGDTAGLDEIKNALTIDDYETVFRGRCSADFTDDDTYKKIVGDFENVIFPTEFTPASIGTQIPRQLSLAKEISFTFVKALRDVVSDFHNNRTNPLWRLLQQRSEEIEEDDYKPIIEMVTELNESIESLEDVQAVRTDIHDTIKATTGETYSPALLSIKSGLPDEPDKLLQSLKLFVGEIDDGYEGEIHEMSLGGANLIYLTLKLLEFKYQKRNHPIANFLLIEEPEAHIHTHIQRTLFENIDSTDTQVIYSTHSPQISEVSNLLKMNVLGISDNSCVAYQPANGLHPENCTKLQRYLDAIRSNLLFAKGVILVEGDAEEILIPVMTRKVLGVSLDELGVSVINIRSTGFENVAQIFHDNRIRRKCAIVTDYDAPIIDTEELPDDSDGEIEFKRKCARSEEAGLNRFHRIENFKKENRWIDSFYAENTFEVDFITAGNAPEFAHTIDDVYSDLGIKRKSNLELNAKDIAIYGRRALIMANHIGKGWFAIILAGKITNETIIPPYIVDAIFFASPQFKRTIWAKIIHYRLSVTEDAEPGETYMADAYDELKRYSSGEKSLQEIMPSLSIVFEQDNFLSIMKKYA